MSDRSLNDFEEKILKNVAEHGCHVNTIFDPEGIDPSFTYSIGFPESVQQPEVIVFGLDHSLMHSMINAVLDQCRNGLKMGDGVVVDDLVDGHPCVLKAVLPDNIIEDRFASAMWFSQYRIGTPMSEAYQIVWPGAVQSLFPWDEGCNESVTDMQPALYEPEIIH